MANTSTTLDTTRASAQELYRKLSAASDSTKDSTKSTAQADFKIAHDEVQKLGASIKAEAVTQPEAVKVSLHEAAAKLEASGTKAEAIVEANPRLAAAGLQVGVLAAVRALSNAVATGRSDTVASKTANKKKVAS